MRDHIFFHTWCSHYKQILVKENNSSKIFGNFAFELNQVSWKRLLKSLMYSFWGVSPDSAVISLPLGGWGKLYFFCIFHTFLILRIMHVFKLEAFSGFTSKPLQVHDSNLIGPRMTVQYHMVPNNTGFIMTFYMIIFTFPSAHLLISNTSPLNQASLKNQPVLYIWQEEPIQRVEKECVKQLVKRIDPRYNIEDRKKTIRLRYVS